MGPIGSPWYRATPVPSYAMGGCGRRFGNSSKIHGGKGGYVNTGIPDGPPAHDLRRRLLRRTLAAPGRPGPCGSSR
eukprot:3897141-Alexandrium_andersonii.AAC.1